MSLRKTLRSWIALLGLLAFSGGCAFSPARTLQGGEEKAAEVSAPVVTPVSASVSAPVSLPQALVAELPQVSAASGPPVLVEPRTGMELVLVRGGCFFMGASPRQERPREEPSGEVCLDDFYIGRTEVTQGQWLKLMKGNPSIAGKGEVYPVDSVSWQDAQAFISLLDAEKGRYLLPTEAQWEYAARSGGRDERMSGGDNEDVLGWYEDNSGGTSHPVAMMRPNGLGLYDMTGNVSEWCRDWYSLPGFHEGVRVNPGGPSEGTQKVIRGDNWDSPGYRLDSAPNRSGAVPSGVAVETLGFRVVYEPGR